MVAIGELNKRVTFRRRTDLPNDDMAITPFYSDEFTRWARLRQVGGAQYQGSVQIGSVITHRITVRFLLGLTVDHEAFISLHDGTERVFRIKKITELAEGGRFLQLDVEELGITYGENVPAVF
jgi:head-tail adaptor